MTKYREILRLKSLGLSQQSIADSCNVSKKTVNRVLKRAKELNISWPLDKSDTDAVLAEMFFLLQSKSDPINGCLTTIMSTKNYSVTESVRNSCGQNTWRTVMQMARNHLCIPSSAITSSRMSRNDVLPCISTGNLVSRLRSIGQEILQQSLIRILVRSPKPIYLSA